MTRQDIEREFTVKDGRIISPGKFESEPVYAPYFWEKFLEGEGTGDIFSAEINVTNADRQLFPELGKAKSVFLAELDNGFVVTDTRE